MSSSSLGSVDARTCDEFARHQEHATTSCVVAIEDALRGNDWRAFRLRRGGNDEAARPGIASSELCSPNPNQGGWIRGSELNASCVSVLSRDKSSRTVLFPLVKKTPQNEVTQRLIDDAGPETGRRLRFYREFPQGLSNSDPLPPISPAAPRATWYRLPPLFDGRRLPEVSESLTCPDPGVNAGHNPTVTPWSRAS